MQAGQFLSTIILIIIGCLGVISSLVGLLIFGFGLLANAPQLKLDTNLDRSSVTLSGAGGITLGIILIATHHAI
jgi:hypothetical protein